MTTAVADRKDIFKAIHRSQHCQRNWNLEQQIPQEDIDLILESVTQCPSKQNASFYKIHVLQDRKIIEDLHSLTKGFGIDEDTVTTNTQTLANLVLVFETANRTQHFNRLAQQYVDVKREVVYESVAGELDKDLHMAAGVAAGYANLTASLLGYATGCCACFDPVEVNKLLELEDNVLLIMGIGIAGNKPRRVHHLNDEIVFPTRKKQPVEVIYK